MAFLVTARKWRPKTFPEVIGQQGVSRTLQNALRAGRIAHAYIFAGPRGIGKTTTARLLAKAVNCEQGPTPDPCNECIHCREISEGRSLDVLEIDGASNRGVGEIRNLRDNIHFNPAACKKKIYIIDEVHMLTIEAFNALLKTLEEPPEHAMFIFATTEINRVPATILSRCQRFDFRRLATKEIAEHLRHICDLEEVKAQDEALDLLARRADGAMRDAQSLLDQMITFAPDGFTTEDVRSALGIVPEDLFFKVSDLVLQSREGDVFTIVEEIDAKGISPREFLRGLCDHFLNFLKAADPKSAEYVEASREIRQRYQDDTGKFGNNDLLRILAILQDAFTDVRRHPQPKLKLELTLLRLASLDRTVQIEDLLNELRGKSSTTKGRKETNTPSQTETNPRTSAPPPPVETNNASAAKTEGKNVYPLDIATIKSRWQNIIDQICEGKMSLACQLKLGHPRRIENGTLIVGFGKDLHDLQLERLQKVTASGSLDNAVKATFEQPVRFRFERLEDAELDKLSQTQQNEDPLETELIRCLGAKRIG